MPEIFSVFDVVTAKKSHFRMNCCIRIFVYRFLYTHCYIRRLLSAYCVDEVCCSPFWVLFKIGRNVQTSYSLVYTCRRESFIPFFLSFSSLS